MVTRYLVIVLAFGVAALQAWRGHVIEAAGLVGLGTGLVLLRLENRSSINPGGVARPALRWLAWACFAVTAAAMVVVFQRDY
jgi:hypothetical protein